MTARYSGIQRSSHNHLDGSRALLSILPYLHILSGKRYPFNQWADHHGQIISWFSDVHRDIVEKFSVTTGVMQNRETISLAAETYVAYYDRKGFVDLKATIAPQYHVLGGLTEKEAMDYFIDGFKKGMEKAKVETGRKVRARLLWGIGREVPSEESERLVQIAASCDREHVAGISLVCHEPSNPPEKHLGAFQLAKAVGLAERRCHVEWVKDRKEEEKNTPDKILKNYEEDKAQLRKNLETAIFRLDVTHIDHAFSLADNEDLIEEVVKRNIGVTVCPGTLLFAKLIHDVQILKLKKLLNAGVRLSIDADDDLFLMDVDEVIQLCNDHYRFTPKEMTRLNENA